MTHSMYEKHLPKPSDDALVLICGPEAMINQTAKPLLVSALRRRLAWTRWLTRPRF